MSRYILSVDSGTTSCRAIVFDSQGKTIGVGQHEFTQFFPKPGWVEHDAEEVLKVQLQCISDAIAAAKIKGEEIAAVGITNQRETTVVWDRKTGKPVHKAIVWQDRRTQDVADALKRESNVFREKTGLVPDAYFSGPKIQWILKNVKDGEKRARAGELAFGTIDTWLIYNLTGGTVHATESSNASRTMLYNMHTMDWDDELLARLSVPRAMMPQVLDSNGDFGTTKKEVVGFEAPIAGVLGDQQAALFGQTCFETGSAKCTYGTGAFLLINIGHAPHLVPGLLTTLGWKLAGEKPTYALEGAIFIAGAAVQWLRDGLGIIASSEETEALAKSIDSNEGVYFVPALVGLGSPWWNSDVRGTITGITRGTGRAHFVRAALESMTYGVADVVTRMREYDLPVVDLRVDGGATKNNFLLQFQADVLRLPVVRSSQVESTAWGVAALAGLKVGLIKSKKELEEAWQKGQKFEVKNDRGADYSGWQAALRATFAQAGQFLPVEPPAVKV
ncbi:MAG: glycerol kinase GlpK [Candidatus Obscuribacterales bacterium]